MAATCLLIAGCGAATGTSGSPTVTISAPADGADVGSSFALRFSSSEEIGPTTSGKHHVHVSTDGQADDYTVVTASPFQVTGLPPGRHTVSVTLQHADHSAAGASDEITVNVTGSGGGASPEPEQSYGGGY
ncbi:hypothetical protein ITP53_01155 [Nonomuraea sp. K274]|uniref:Uncharacterized protein n=1 Tax=Nonomuraea cypriaca TaxID=1187855 RepID=A0A931A1C2_9ACTN|nr:hypothetical protein [Nonomuraea cypriaca]MBF8184377.1 hypothetical protein [Nonomuraea cypriaca]